MQKVLRKNWNVSSKPELPKPFNKQLVHAFLKKYVSKENIHQTSEIHQLNNCLWRINEMTDELWVGH